MAANVLLEICGNTKRAFRPYSEDMAKVVLQLLKCTTPGSLRRVGAKYFKNLLLTCATKEEMLKLFEFIYPTFREAIVSAIQVESHRDIKALLKQLSAAIREFSNGPPMLSPDGMVDLCDLMDKCLCAFEKFEKERNTESKKVKELSEEDMDEIMSEIDKNAKIVTNAMEISGLLCKIYGKQCEAPFVNKLIKHYVAFWEDTCSRLQLASICFFCDILEHLPGTSVSFLANQKLLDSP
jgi:hypothetical protein